MKLDPVEVRKDLSIVKLTTQADALLLELGEVIERMAALLLEGAGE